MSQEAGDTSSSGTAADAPAQKSSQQSTPAASTSAPSTSAPEKSDSSAAAAPKEDSAASAASQALKASKEEEEKSKAQDTASEAVEKGGLISGKFQISLTQNYTHMQTNQLYIEGFGILPIVVVGNVDIQNVRRDIFTTIVGASYKLTNRFQVSINVPWQYSMSSISTATGIKGRDVGTANNEKTSQSSSLGDITVGMFYQLTRESLSLPSLSGSLDLKLRNGRDIFETPDPAAHVPAGTGFYMLRASLSASKTSAPAVVYGAFGFAYNFARHKIPYAPANQPAVLIDSYEPGPSFNVSAGVSLSLNYQLSLNWSLAEASQLSSKVNGRVSPNSATNAITFRMGAIYRVSSKTSVDLSLTTGLTNDAGGTTISLRLPWSY